MVEEGPIWLQFHQQIDIAVATCFPARYRAYKTDFTSAVFVRDLQNALSLFLDLLIYIHNCLLLEN